MCILCQQTSPKHWFGNRTMTSFCAVTNSAHQMQMTTLCRWMKPSPWKVSADATAFFQIDLKAFLAWTSITALLAFNLVKKINSLKIEYNKLSVSNLSQFMKRNQLSIDKHQNKRGLQIFNNFSENAFLSHWITWRQFTVKKQVFVGTTLNFHLYDFIRTGSTKIKNQVTKSVSKYSYYSCINRCLSVQLFVSGLIAVPSSHFYFVTL